MPNSFRFLTLCIFLLGSLCAKAQNLLQQEIELSKGQYSPVSLLSELQKNDIPVAFSSDKLPDLTIVIEQTDQYSVERLLSLLTDGSLLRYRVSSGMIIISLTDPEKSAFRVISGTISDAESGEVLIGATVQQMENDYGVVSDSYGKFSIRLSQGQQVIKTSFLGYKSRIDTFFLKNKSRVINLSLQPKTESLNAVTVSAIDKNYNITSLIPGINTFNLNTQGQIPYFLGEVDVLQGATTLPGIRTLGEDANGLNIRGGSVDQNLVLLDEATVYNPNHLYGLISIFNPESVNNIEIIKGFIPPKFGGRASAVINVHQKEGNDQKYEFTGGIGLVSARFIAEGPLKKETSSFIISGRQSLLNLSFDDNNTQTSFQDINAKVNWKANDKNTFYFSGYFGNDTNKNIFDRVRNWGNRNYSLRWNHLYGRRLFANFSAILSEYEYKVKQPREAASFIGTSKIIDYTLKSDWGFTLNDRHDFNFGGSAIFHRLKPGDRIPFDEGPSSSNPLFLDEENGLESALYISHTARLTPKLSVLYGLRWSALHNFGPGEAYVYQPNQTRTDESITDTIQYKNGELIESYTGLAPRASIQFQQNPSLSFKASFSKTYQYLHLISNTITPQPTDIWKLSDAYIAPTEANHYSLGIYKNFNNDMWESYIEGYYKSIQHLITYKNGADLLFNSNPETELLDAEGRAFGLEFFLKKNRGKLTGWISYTLSRSDERVTDQFETINNGNYYPSNHDKRHDLSIVGIYKLLPRLVGSASIHYHTGAPFTLPVGQYQFEDIVVPDYERRNEDRLPNYHRLDLSLKWIGKPYKKDGTPRKLTDYWTFVVYNVYSRDNIYAYVLNKDEFGATQVEPYTIFDNIIPAITYHFKF